MNLQSLEPHTVDFPSISVGAQNISQGFGNQAAKAPQLCKLRHFHVVIRSVSSTEKKAQTKNPIL